MRWSADGGVRWPSRLGQTQRKVDGWDAAATTIAEEHRKPNADGKDALHASGVDLVAFSQLMAGDS